MTVGTSQLLTHRRWVWHSTPDSYVAGSVSLLALLETFVSMAAYALIAIHVGTAHLTTAVLIAPLLLLRTDESVAYALKHSHSFRANALTPRCKLPRPQTQSLIMLGLFAILLFFIYWAISSAVDGPEHYIASASALAIILMWLGGIVGVIVFVIIPLLMRVLATLHGLYINPEEAISNIPRNWWHHVACLDTLHPPEILPGAIGREQSLGSITELQPYGYFFARVSETFNPRNTTFTKFWGSVKLFALLLSYLSAIIPAYLFRLSIKGTSLLLLPLIWLVYDSQSNKPEYFVKSSLVKAIYKVSYAILMIGLGVICTRVLDTDFGLTESLQKFLRIHESNVTIAAFFPPNKVPLWQCFLLATCLISVCTYHFAERLSIRGRETADNRLFKSLQIILGTLAACLIISLAYTSASVAAS